MVGRAEAAPATVQLRSPRGPLEGTILARVGMPGWPLRPDGDELLGHPVPLQEYLATGDPPGIPLLHPWANRLASPEYGIAGRRVRPDVRPPTILKDPNGLPSHGLAAAAPHWEGLEEEPARIRA